jgi:hypothetical protein
VVRRERRARVVPVRWLPARVAGMTLRHTILVRREYADDEALLDHEMVHVRQWEELGVPRFLWRYLSAYARGRLGGLSHDDAYRAIPLEAEARQIAGR